MLWPFLLSLRLRFYLIFVVHYLCAFYMRALPLPPPRLSVYLRLPRARTRWRRTSGRDAFLC